MEALAARLSNAARQTRVLYLIGQLQVVLKPGQSEREGESIAEALLCQFEIDKRALIGEADVDLAGDRAVPSVAKSSQQIASGGAPD